MFIRRVQVGVFPFCLCFDILVVAVPPPPKTFLITNAGSNWPTSKVKELTYLGFEKMGLCVSLNVDKPF